MADILLGSKKASMIPKWIPCPARNDKSGDEGIYVDVGAYHPKLFSNTYLFYKRGWRGICVDPNPEVKGMFGVARPRDVFVNVGVGGVNKKLKYFIFDEGATNTFSAEQAKRNQEVGRKLVGKKEVEILSLKKILDKYLGKGKKIDLLSVDVEGMDLEVLKSNDWKKYRPRVIICEDLEFDLNGYFD